MSSKPIALIIGSGPRVGAAVAQKFASIGYSVAVTSRSKSGGKTSEGYLSIKADLSSPSAVPEIFQKVKSELNGAPSVVVYNAAALTPPPNNDLFALPIESLVGDLNTNTVSVYAAAQEAVKGWATLPSETKKLFIYTGNKANVAIAPILLTVTLGVGKSASSYLLGMADSQYTNQGYR